MVKAKARGDKPMKKCAVFNDLSGFGKCSLCAAVPILSVMGTEVHPVPTAVLTRQSCYDKYSMIELTDFLPSFLSDWQGEKFDAIITGYIADNIQCNVIEEFIERYRGDNTLLIVDPVMADDGALYDGFDEERCRGVFELVKKADIITPNLTELSLICSRPYTENFDEISDMAFELAKNGPQYVVVTGIKSGDKCKTAVFDRSREAECFSSKLFPGSFSGTGDLFVSVLAGAVLKGMTVQQGAKLAVEFIGKAIESTDLSENPMDGIAFEKHLGELL